MLANRQKYTHPQRYAQATAAAAAASAPAPAAAAAGSDAMEDTTRPEAPQPALNDLVPREVVERLGRTLAETAGTGNTAQLDSLNKIYEELRSGSYATPQVFFSLNRHLQAAHLGARGKAPPKRTRFPVGFVSLFPELSYLEEISHDGFLVTLHKGFDTPSVVE
jgi:hypothetical protein